MAIDLKDKDTALVRKLVAAGIPPARARLLADLVAGFRATLSESGMVRHISSEVTLPVIALMLGEMLTVNTEFFKRLTPESQKDWISTADVLELLAIAQREDPAPPPLRDQLPMRVVSVQDLMKVIEDRDQERNPLEDEAADLAQEHGGSTQPMGKA